MKKLFTILITLLAVGTASAQWRLGVTGGAALNWHLTDYGYAKQLSNGMGAGGTVMVMSQYNFKNWIGLRADFGWAQRNYIEYMASSEDKYATNLAFIRNYLLFPVTVNFSFGNERVRGYADVGGFIGGWVSGTSAYPKQAWAKYEFDSRRDGRFDAGVVARLGISVFVSDNVFLNVEATDYVGLVNSHYTGTEYFYQNAYDNTLAIQLGIGYRFK